MNKKLSMLFAIIVISTMLCAQMSFGNEEGLKNIKSIKLRIQNAKEKKNQEELKKEYYELEFETGELHYNTQYEMAVFYAKNKDISNAYKYLNKAVKSGFWDMKKIINEKSFIILKNEPLFKSLVNEAWSNGYLEMLERPEREEFQRTEKIMSTLSIKKGETIADIGAGSGYFTIRLAKQLQGTGKVIAMDIRQKMLDYIEFRRKIEKLDNISFQLVTADNPNLEKNSIDTILMADTMHYIKDKIAYCKKLKLGLKPTGRIIIIDFIPKSFKERPWGPHESQQFSKKELIEIMDKAGLKLSADHTFLPEQYFVEFQIK